MKILCFLLIVLVSLSLCLTSANAITRDAFLMKTNSVGKIYTNYTRDDYINDDMKIYADFAPYNTNSPLDTNKISLSVQPDSLLNHQTIPVTYTITASNDSKGYYYFGFGPCGEYYLLIVGINGSEIAPSTIHEYLLPREQEGCSQSNMFHQSVDITGYSNITPVTLSENSNGTNVLVQPLTVPEFTFAEIVLAFSIVSAIFLYQFKSKMKI